MTDLDFVCHVSVRIVRQELAYGVVERQFPLLRQLGDGNGGEHLVHGAEVKPCVEPVRRSPGTASQPARPLAEGLAVFRDQNGSRKGILRDQVVDERVQFFADLTFGQLPRAERFARRLDRGGPMEPRACDLVGGVASTFKLSLNSITPVRLARRITSMSCADDFITWEAASPPVWPKSRTCMSAISPTGKAAARGTQEMLRNKPSVCLTFARVDRLEEDLELPARGRVRQCDHLGSLGFLGCRRLSMGER